MKNVKALAVIDSETLMNSEFRERKFCVETLLPQGLCMLAGAPKIGKSWMALDLALHVAKGEALWGLKVHPGTVLYLCLEDGNGRIHDRLNAITDEGAGNLFLSFEADSLNDGLIPQLMNFKKEHPDLALIIIDTFQQAGKRYLVCKRLRGSTTGQAPCRRVESDDSADSPSAQNGRQRSAEQDLRFNGHFGCGGRSVCFGSCAEGTSRRRSGMHGEGHPFAKDRTSFRFQDLHLVADEGQP